MVFKASLNGPNRAKVKGNNLSLSNQKQENHEERSAIFRVKAMEILNLEQQYLVGGRAIISRSGEAVDRIMRIHNSSRQQDDKDNALLIHFHDFPVFVTRVDIMPVGWETGDEDCIYLNKLQRFNQKVCEDTFMKVTLFKSESEDIRFLELEVQGLWDDKQNSDRSESVGSEEVAKVLLSQYFNSVVTVNELIICPVTSIGKCVVCRVSGILLDSHTEFDAEQLFDNETFRGRVGVNTECYIFSGEGNKSLMVKNEGRLPEKTLPNDVIHISTSDLEWFPVRRSLLAPCIELTKYVQHGKGKYKDFKFQELPCHLRSPDAPNDEHPHVSVPMNCCVFDRVLLFLISLSDSDDSQTFELNPTEINSIYKAAKALGLQALMDLCSNKMKSFESRVRKDRFIRFSEVEKRNKGNNELLLILDGMVLDITKWLERHPGGPSIIPAQATNIDCTVFFEMYHVSRQSFLYLKSFYIGELHPDDLKTLKSSAEGAKVSSAFLESLRSFTAPWRLQIDEKEAIMGVHKSF